MAGSQLHDCKLLFSTGGSDNANAEAMAGRLKFAFVFLWSLVLFRAGPVPVFANIHNINNGGCTLQDSPRKNFSIISVHAECSYYYSASLILIDHLCCGEHTL